MVPKDKNGKRVANSFTFHYQGYTCDAFDKLSFTRGEGEVKLGDLKPESRKGCLDVNVLKKHGLTAERVRNDPLFFLQLLLPIYDPALLDIEGDDRMPHFTHDGLAQVSMLLERRVRVSCC